MSSVSELGLAQSADKFPASHLMQMNDIGNEKWTVTTKRSDRKHLSPISEEETKEPGLGILDYKDRRRPYKEQEVVAQRPLARSPEAGSFPLDQI